MKLFTTLKTPAAISTILVLPLVLLELIFNRVTVENAPDLAILFGLLWLLPTTGATILLHISRSRGSTVGSAFGVVILVLVMALWSVILIDQAPCFVGTPNCD